MSLDQGGVLPGPADHGSGDSHRRWPAHPDSRVPPAASSRPGTEQALNLAFRYLNRRERTVAEARAHLRGQDVDPGRIEEVITTLTEQGYLDDRRFAQLFVQDKRELEQWGDERIRLRLKARGIERELAEHAISEGACPDREHDRAAALLRRRIPEPQPGRRGWERALGLLLRRGYDYEVAAEAARKHLAGTSP